MKIETNKLRFDPILYPHATPNIMRERAYLLCDKDSGRCEIEIPLEVVIDATSRTETFTWPRSLKILGCVQCPKIIPVYNG